MVTTIILWYVVGMFFSLLFGVINIWCLREDIKVYWWEWGGLAILSWLGIIGLMALTIYSTVKN